MPHYSVPCGCCGMPPIFAECCEIPVPTVLYGELCGTVPDAICPLVGQFILTYRPHGNGWDGPGGAWYWSGTATPCGPFFGAPGAPANGTYPLGGSCDSTCVFVSMVLYCGADQVPPLGGSLAGWIFSTIWYYSDCSEDITAPDYPLHFGGYVVGSTQNSNSLIFGGSASSCGPPLNLVIDRTGEAGANAAIVRISTTPPGHCGAASCPPTTCEECSSSSSSSSSGGGDCTDCVPCDCDSPAPCLMLDFGSSPIGGGSGTCCAPLFGPHILTSAGGCVWSEEDISVCNTGSGMVGTGWQIYLHCYDPGDCNMVTEWVLTTMGGSYPAPIYTAALSQFNCVSGGIFNLIDGGGYCFLWPSGPITVSPCMGMDRFSADRKRWLRRERLERSQRLRAAGLRLPCGCGKSRSQPR